MMTKKIMATLVLAVFSSVAVANRAIAQEPTRAEKDAKKADKGKTAEAPPTGQKSEEDKGKGHEGERKETNKCNAAKLETREIDKKTKSGYICSAADTCTKACNLWRTGKSPTANESEFVAKQDEWKEVSDGDRRNYRYSCKCEDAK
jgi:DNA invertase Pin-like site-specific DNA recombinase